MNLNLSDKKNGVGFIGSRADVSMEEERVRNAIKAICFIYKVFSVKKKKQTIKHRTSLTSICHLFSSLEYLHGCYQNKHKSCKI